MHTPAIANTETPEKIELTMKYEVGILQIMRIKFVKINLFYTVLLNYIEIKQFIKT